jgi:uncharacterized membrane protein
MKAKRIAEGMFLGLCTGAVAGYFADPEFGEIRRAAFARGAKRILARAAQEGKKSFYDSRNHLAGLVSQYSPRFRAEPASDGVLEQRIRARLGRVVSHPRKVHVVCQSGVATLWGVVPQEEISDLVRVVEATAGVKEVLDHLEIGPADEFPATQNDALRQARDEIRLNWSPSKRVLVGTAGAALAIKGLRSKGWMGKALAVLGAGMVARSTMRNHLRATLALSDASPGFELRKTVRINAPISDLFDFWTNPENYPRAFSHVAKIERLGENLFRWTISGPAGIPIGWDGMITRIVPNTLVEWKSMPGSSIGNFGVVHFDPHYDASTRIDIRMFYRPPAGRFFAEIFGPNPGEILDQDLKRLKYLFEKGGLEEEESELLKTATT